MRDILYVDLSHANSEFNRSNDIEDLELFVSVNIKMADRWTYEDEAALKSSLLNISTSEYIPKDKDKLYFLPGTNVPRIKLKNLASTQGIKTTRAIDTADAIFAARTSLDKLTEQKWEYPIGTEIFKKFIEGAKDYFVEERDLDKLEIALANYTEDEVLVPWQTWRILTDDSISFHIDTQGQDSNGNAYNQNERYLVIAEGKEEICQFLLTGVATIYDQSEILRHVNGEDSVTIDSNVYDNLNMMFDSSDTDNHLLAMEIMANSNYNESLLYLQMLFMGNAGKMDNLREKNHVNFKSLLSYLDKTTGTMRTSLDDIMSSLRANKRLTEENIITLLTHEAKKELSLSGSYQYFTIKTISLAPEFLAELGVDINFKLQDDFVPVIEEPIEESEDWSIAKAEEVEFPQQIEVDAGIHEDGHTDASLENKQLSEEAEQNRSADEEADMIENEEIIQEREADYVQDVLDKAAEEGSEEDILPKIDDTEAENELEAQAEFSMIDAKNEELNLDSDGGFDI